MRSHTQSPAPSSSHAGRQAPHLVDEARRLQLAERALEMRLLALPLGMAEAREERHAVHHHRRVGGEDEIGQPLFRRHQMHGRAERLQGAMERAPFALGGERRAPALRRPRSPGSIHGLIE